MEHQFEKFSTLKHHDTIALPHTTPIPEKADTTCSACWGSGWETQFVTPCRECNGTGHVPKKAVFGNECEGESEYRDYRMTSSKPLVPEKAEESEDELWYELMNRYAHVYRVQRYDNPIIQEIKKHFEIKRKV
jgi:RecJ-like exonuclease